MQGAFATVLWVVCGVGILFALVALARNGKTWEEFGRNRLLMESESSAGHARPASAAAVAERDEEIRQMLQARNARRERRGERPLDVEAELRRLVAPQIDAELRAEIRDLVVARNARRARRGQPPLDVAAEVEREIAQLNLES
jgi:hypothetical protein